MILCNDSLEYTFATPDNVHSCSGYDGANECNKTADDNLGTYWAAFPANHWIIYDMGRSLNITNVRVYLSGLVYPCYYQVYVSENTTDWGSSVGECYLNATGVWLACDDNITAKVGRYINLTNLKSIGTGGACVANSVLASFAEFDATAYKCEVYEYNFTMNASHPGGTWTANVTATDSEGSRINGTEFDFVPPNPKWFDNSTNNTVAGEPTLFSVNWTDNKGLSGYIFSINNGTEDWIIPNNDTSTDWVKPWLAFDGATATYTYIIKGNPGWTSYLMGNVSEPITLSQIRYTTHISGATADIVEVTIYNGTWTTVYNDTAFDGWHYPIFDKIDNATKVRLRWYNSDAGPWGPWVYEIQLSGFVNDTWTNDGGSFAGTTAWSNVTKAINETEGATIKWRVFANDTDNLWKQQNMPHNGLTIQQTILVQGNQLNLV